MKIYSPIENHILYDYSEGINLQISRTFMNAKNCLLYRTTDDIIEYIDFYSFSNSENSRGWDMMENTTITGQYEVLLPWHVIV